MAFKLGMTVDLFMHGISAHARVDYLDLDASVELHRQLSKQ